MASPVTHLGESQQGQGFKGGTMTSSETRESKALCHVDASNPSLDSLRFREVGPIILKLR